MNEIIEKELNIEDMIYEIRGKQVMLDSDLAKLYNVETKRINEAVSRNSDKFPYRFAFRITEKETEILKSQFATSSSSNNYGGSRKGHTVFTEQGVAMLATVLKSKAAIQTSINIMDAFVKMRHYIKDNLLDQQNINSIVLEDHSHILKMDGDLKLLQEAFDKLEDKKRVNETYFDGEFYKAFSRVIDIFNQPMNELAII